MRRGVFEYAFWTRGNTTNPVIYPWWHDPQPFSKYATCVSAYAYGDVTYDWRRSEVSRDHGDIAYVYTGVHSAAYIQAQILCPSSTFDG